MYFLLYGYANTQLSSLFSGKKALHLLKNCPQIVSEIYMKNCPKCRIPLLLTPCLRMKLNITNLYLKFIDTC